MQIFQTKKQKEFAKLPTALDFQRIMMQREIDTSKDILNMIKRLEAGEAGENFLVEKLEAYGHPDWTIIRNLRLKDYSTFEIDVVLLTKNCVYLFEVKNYTGHFKFDQGNSYFNGVEINSNIVQQTRSALLNLRNICGKFSKRIQVHGVLVFIGENNQVSIQSDSGEVRILTRTDLYAFIQEILAAENQYALPNFNHSRLIDHLEKFETENNYAPDPLTKEEVGRARPGIYCARCASYEVEITKNYVICSCGLHEPRDEAMIRTICEYGVLTYNRPFTKGEVLEFIGEDTSERYLRKILHKYFHLVQKSRYTYYENYKLPYYLIMHLFKISAPVIFYSKRGLPDVYMLE